MSSRMAETPTTQSYREIAEAVPTFERFFRVDELRERDEQLAADYDHVSFEVIGESASGDEMWSVTLGNGSETALLFAAPHPNEPIGCMTLDFLAHELATNDSLRDSLDYEFVLVKAADPDGLRLNEGWFDGPFTISNYAQNYYRPASDEQVEWTFPFERDDYQFDDPTPETEVLMELIETHKPGFVYSLHNAGFGGCYYYLSEPLSGMYQSLHDIPADHKIPLHLGEAELPTMDELDEAIYHMPGVSGLYEMFAEHGEKDPSETLAGASSLDYARRMNQDAVQLIVELPYFREPRITDQSETDQQRREVILQGLEQAMETIRLIDDQYEAVGSLLPDGRLKRTIADFVARSEERIATERNWAQNAEETARPATVAEKMDSQYVMQFYMTLTIGTFMRLIDKTAMQATGVEYDQLITAKRTLEREFHKTMETLVTELDYEPIPIRELVAVQARAGLTCLAHLEETDYFESE